MDVIATVQSQKQASKILQNMISVGGGWISEQSNEWAPIYKRYVGIGVGTNLEEMYVERESAKRWRIVKTATPQ